MSLPNPDPSVQAVRLTDFDQLVAVFANWQGRVEQISSGQFEGTIQLAVGSVIRLVVAEGNQRLRLRGRDASGLLGIYPLIDGMTTAVWTGSRHDLGQIVVGGSDDETDICSGRKFAGRAAFVHPDMLEQAARALLHSDEVALPRHSRVHAPSPSGFAEVDRLLARLLQDSLADPALLGAPEGRQLEQECLQALVAALLPSPAPQALASLSTRSQLLDRAEEFLRARLGAPVGMVDLCQEIGASERTLRFAFRERYGVGPMVYYRYLRLNAVRSQLKAAPHLAVADVARAHGFHHLGNFAADYRRLFGIRPSETERLS